jgi:hypothetical protein
MNSADRTSGTGSLEVERDIHPDDDGDGDAFEESRGELPLPHGAHRRVGERPAASQDPDRRDVAGGVHLRLQGDDRRHGGLEGKAGTGGVHVPDLAGLLDAGKQPSSRERRPRQGVPAALPVLAFQADAKASSTERMAASSAAATR